MDDNSTYNNIYRNASPMTPSTPGNAFQTNVNRTKTRKWVEAKKVDYGGDDWGDDFDDDEEPEEPQPTSRVTAGLRPIGQAAQPSASQSTGNRSVSQPTSAFGHIRGESFGQRNPSGPPALHIQTQQPTPTRPFQRVETEPWTDPATFDEPDHRYPESVISPQSATSKPFPPLPGYPGRREYSPASQDRGRGSPAPANTGPISTSRFPPRKSSMGQQDAPPHGSTSGSMTGSRPGSSGRPWTQQRSDSPGHQAPASTGTQNKPLPFIRPADIYRRMEEEKEKERRSMDSAGRPSLDSIQGSGQSLPDQRRRTSFDREDGSDASRSAKPTLPSVAERRSEYGFDRMVNEVGKAFPADATTHELTSKPEAISSQPSIAAPVPASNQDQPLKSPEGGRKSVSPRLPDLARMSGFGTDFFSGPSALTGTDEPAQATLFGSKSEPRSTLLEQEKASKSSGQLSLASRMTDDTQTATNDIENNDDDNVHRASSLIKGPTLSHDDELTQQPPTSKASGISEPQGSDNDLQPSVPSLSTTVKERAKPSRPSLPGGWVTESSLGAETPPPTEQSGTMRSQLSPINDTSETSPVTDLAVGDIAPTTAVKHAHFLQTTPKTTPKAQNMEGASEYDFGNSTGKHDQIIASKVVTEETKHHSNSQTLPPLQTPDPLPGSKPPPLVDQDLPASEAPSNNDSPSKDVTTSYPEMATTSSGFTPTAPLNPKRGDASASEFVAPSFLPRNFTASSMDTTSPNESDKLREDIIKSLSPIDPALAKSLAVASSTDESPTKSSPEMTRESRYLSGVYDEYMGFNEEKSLRDTTSVWRNEGSTDSPGPAEARPAQTADLREELSSEPAQSAAPTNSGHEPFLQRRFSWEQLPEHAVVSPAEELASQARAPDAAHEVLTTTESTVNKDAPAPALQIEPDNGGTMSHQVSLVSSHAPGGLGIAGIEPPSPISVLSSERSPGVIDNPGRRLSLMEEKVLIQASSNPVSPSPEAQHPALATKTPPESSPVLESADVVAPPKFVNITGWREILSLPSPALRIQRFDETRTQYTEMDSGLSNWLEHMRGQADYEVLTASSINFTGISGSAASSHGPNQTSPTGAQPPAQQQPYYQQYLNASNDKLASAPTGIVRQSTGNVLSSGRQPTSGFGTSKNQVGTKGKEFLQAAGSFGNKATKAGMKSGLKLFNKGKDKLRGSGDKVFQ